MIELNGKKLCENCFLPVADGEVCTGCNGDTHDGNALPVGSVLHGRYVVGKSIYYDSSYYCYYGMDIERNKRVLIRELFPFFGGNIYRSDDRLSLGTHSPEAKGFFDAEKKGFFAETRIMSELGGHNVFLNVCELFEENNTAYSVCEFTEHMILLSDYMDKQGGSLGEDETFHIMKDVIKKLDVLHSLGQVHGNIRPENIVIDTDSVLLTGLRSGSFEYYGSATIAISPYINSFAAAEQYSKSSKVSFATDIYSLGAVFFNVLSGKFLKGAMWGDSFDECAMNTSYIFSPKFMGIMKKMLAVTPTERYGNLYELCVALNDADIMKISLKKPRISKDSERGSKKDAYKTEKDSKKTDSRNAEKKPDKKIIAIIAGLAVVGLVAIFALISLCGGGDDAVESSALSEATDTSDATSSDSEGRVIEITLPEPDTSHQLNGGDMMSTSLNEDSEYIIGSDKYKKADITYVEICDNLKTVTFDSWDISASKDRSTIAWIIKNEDGTNTLCIGSEGGVDATDSCRNLFYNFTNLQGVNFNGNFHTEYATDMSLMFKNCKNLKSVDLSGISTESAASFESMFENCIQLESVYFPEGFNTSSVITFRSMFDACRSLREINIGMFDTSAAIDFTRMFYSCSGIGSLNLANFTTANVWSMEEMFAGCSLLSNLDIINFTASENTNVKNMFDSCNALKAVNTNDKIIKDAFFASKPKDTETEKTKPNSDKNGSKNPSDNNDKKGSNGSSKPKQPSSKTPEKPSSKTPDQPSSETPKQPSSEAPKQPASETSDKPSSETSEKPSSEAPKQPASETPKQPASEAPKQPSSETSEKPSSETPKQPSSDTTVKATQGA